MCGIFGYVGTPTNNNNAKLHDFMSHLAHESEVRGTHSTGFSARHDSGLVVADKLPYRGSTFCMMSGKYRALRKKMPSTFIGHTRYGTGSNPRINNNNHPFFGNEFHMVHNGVIAGWRDIAKREGVLDQMQSETDSEIVLRILEKRLNPSAGRRPVFKKQVEYILDNVWGNMAIALLDLNSPNVWLFRNENPINIFFVPQKIFGSDMMFFASTKKIFEEAWKACFGNKATKDINDSRFLSANQLYKLSTIATPVGNQMKKFLWYPISVHSPFSKVGQYYQGYGAGSSTTTSSYQVKKPDKHFYSSVVDPTMPELGCHFSKQEMTSVKSALSGSGDTGTITLDGMTVSEFTVLNNLWRTLRDISREVACSD